MSGAIATKALKAVHDKDPKEVIWDALKGHLDKLEVTGGDILCCVYERPEAVETDSGVKLILPETASRRSEDKFQGIAALVVKLGPSFHSKYDRELGLDPALKVGDWVTFNTGDTSPFTLGERQMRLLQGNYVRMRIKDPDCVI